MTISGDDAAMALQSAGDAIVTVDLDGHITSWNDQAQRLTGHQAEQAIGQSLALIIPQTYIKRHITGFRKAMQRGHLSHQGSPGPGRGDER